MIRGLQSQDERQLPVWTEERERGPSICGLPRQGAQAIPGISPASSLLTAEARPSSFSQHRFIETAIGSAAGNKASEIAKAFGASDVSDAVHIVAKDIVGDYLRTF